MKIEHGVFVTHLYTRSLKQYNNQRNKISGRELEILQTESQPNRITEHKIMNKKLKKGILPMRVSLFKNQCHRGACLPLLSSKENKELI